MNLTNRIKCICIKSRAPPHNEFMHFKPENAKPSFHIFLAKFLRCLYPNKHALLTSCFAQGAAAARIFPRFVVAAHSQTTRAPYHPLFGFGCVESGMLYYSGVLHAASAARRQKINLVTGGEAHQKKRAHIQTHDDKRTHAATSIYTICVCCVVYYANIN